MDRRFSINGIENIAEYDLDFIDKLKRIWAGDTEMLHAGGLEELDYFLTNEKITKRTKALEICCGEGSSSIYLANKYKCYVFAVDINKRAVEVAKSKSKKANLIDYCFFHTLNIFDLDFKENTFDFIFGLDPDGLAHVNRRIVFEKIFKCLKKKSIFKFNHWIPYLGASKELVKSFDQLSIDVGFNSHINLSADEYIRDLEFVGFKNIQCFNRNYLYEKSMRSVSEKLSKLNINDIWTDNWLKLNQKHPLGVTIRAEK